VDAALKSTASVSRFKKLPHRGRWLCVRVDDYFALFRFTTDAEIAKGRSPGLRMVARIVHESKLIPGAAPPRVRQVEVLLSSEGAQVWDELEG